jgi:hypothetical protein
MVLGPACRRLLRQDGDAEAAFQATFRILLRKAVSLGLRTLPSRLHLTQLFC